MRTVMRMGGCRRIGPPEQPAGSGVADYSCEVTVKPLRLDEDGALLLLDQTLLPGEERWLRCTSAAEVADAIERLAVRGAPAIGLAAAYGLAVEAARGGDVRAAAAVLAATPPTAVNLRWALDRALERGSTAADLLAFAHELAAAQLEQDEAIARHGSTLVDP